MPPTDPDQPVVLTTLPTEPIAALLVARLQSEGIRAELSGTLTSAFRAEAPGGVQILVRADDLPRARQILTAWHPQAT